MTDVAADKIAAFTATDYRVVLGDVAVTMRVGERAAGIAAYLGARGYASAAFITAFNPSSTLRDREENLAAHRTLRNDLVASGMDPLEGIGVDPTGSWEPEPSWFAPGLGREDACRLGRRYGQDAIVWVGADAVPRLVLLR
jgi:hypothetical protein